MKEWLPTCEFYFETDLKEITTKEEALKFIANNGSYLMYLDHFRKDKDVAIAAVTNHPRSLAHVGKKLRKDRELVSLTVSIDGSAIKFADDSLKKDKEIASISVTTCGFALRYLKDYFDKEIVMTAVSNYGSSLQFESSKKTKK